MMHGITHHNLKENNNTLMKNRFNGFVRNYINRLFPNYEAFTFCIGAIICALFFYYFIDALLPIVLSAILAFVLYDPVLWLEKKGIPRSAIVFSILLLLLGFTLLFFAGWAPLILRESLVLLKLLPELNRNTQEFIESYAENLPFIEANMVRESIAGIIGHITSSTQQIVSFSLSSLVSVIRAILYCILVPVLVFFFLYDGAVIYKQFSSRLLSRSDLVETIWQQTLVNLIRYIRGKLIEIIVVSTGSYAVLSLFSMENAFILALATGIAVLIPYVGAVLVAIPVVIIGLYQWGFDATFFYMLLAYGVLQALDAYLLVPLLYSSSLNLRPVTVLVAITFFGGVWGVWGVLIAIPLATFIKVVIAAWPQQRRLS